ncbi:hypothetical protein XENTR_v10001785 [Xenopus tropicalis]|uniref:Uncharacterized protein LOC100487522 n=1 Tax=Xenopus tropicalis TaxID=8364 RepID=A0A8J0QWS1_XENTR|nr:uncharacterized protein LOC100487522 [Xenopus tropicalis]KAE8633112.1 hypothetical protein XENTR_v10001785 [Xenopus tropicalis]|eukprot:XP_002940080.1 PREDICTED: uncharacterized protein LOC100487522 [Xenopus tropicalis]
MAKRKAEHQVATLPPPCKMLAWEISSFQYEPSNSPSTPRRKRKLEVDACLDVIQSPSCNKSPEIVPDSQPSLPCKKQRVMESKSKEYKCQSDDDFKEFNSFNYWRTPLPEIDLSEINIEPEEVNKHPKTKTEILEEMDS